MLFLFIKILCVCCVHQGSVWLFVWFTMFLCGRLSKDNKEEVLEKAGKDLEAVRDQHFARLMRELQGTDFWKLRRAYSPGVCER